jgi:3-phosphoshikimate 1-carboxyvinyltransferase
MFRHQLAVSMGVAKDAVSAISHGGRDVLVIEPSVLSGTLKLPPSKSHAMRWITLASMDQSPTRIGMWEIGKDVQALIDSFCNLGISWNGITIKGGDLSLPKEVLDCANSGTALRFLIAQASTCKFQITLDGDASLRARSSLHLVDSLGITNIKASNLSEYPLVIEGPFSKDVVEIDVSKTSQFYSAIMLMAPRTNGFQIITKGNAVSRQHSALTWNLCKVTGAKEPGTPWEVICPDVEIPADASMLAFARLANLGVTNSPDVSESIGHSLENSNLRDSNDLITPMAAWLSLGEGGTISHASHAAHKESNRITKTVEMLSKFGIETSATDDGIVIKGGQVPRRPSEIVETYGDHRIQMTAILLASICGGIIEGSDLHEIAWPSYIKQLQDCGLKIQLHFQP